MYKVGNVYHGFKLIEESQIEELQSLGRLFVHEKTGARLFHLENADENKVFSIGFRTPPTNDTGVPHIIEHSVLSGSRKYTTKEPFMDMVKSSLRTFINAMTFSDKTIYPVGSRNEKDFFNLMDVYLDAVLFPKIYEVPEIFMQEGWHHDLLKEDDDIVYRGVVYNEMKGAYSSPEIILNQAVSKSLLPDTCYRFSSGGDPDHIPELSQEEFLNFHKRFYHPSNSYIFLYGNGDIDKQLSYINDNYLKQFERIAIDSSIAKQKPLTSRVELTDYYHISKDDSDLNKAYLSLNFVVGDTSEIESYLLSNIMSQLLMESEAAPLKKALLAAGLGEDVFALSSDGQETQLGFVVKNTSPDQVEKFTDVVFSTLRCLVAEGIDKDLIKASINVAEYDLRESSGFATKGIIYEILAFNGWLYDKSPIQYLKYNDVFKKLRARIDTDFYENYLKEKFLDNNHSSLVILLPKKGLAEEKAQVVKTRLKAYKEALSPEALKNLIAENEKLKNFQAAPDSEEAKATIPKLAISDVDEKATVISQEVIKEKDFTLLYHNLFTSQITYLDFYFDLAGLDEKYIPYVPLLANILTKINTKNQTYEQLSNAIFANTGGISLSSDVFVKEEDKSNLLPKMLLSGKAIGNNLKTLIELMAEVIFQSEITDKNRIKEILFQTKSRVEMGMAYRGNAVAANRVSSYYSVAHHYAEKLKGLDYYWFLSDLLSDYDNRSVEILENLNFVYRNVFNKNNLLVSVTGDRLGLDYVLSSIDTVLDKLNAGKATRTKYSYVPKQQNEGVLANYNVQYVAKGYDFKNLGYDFTGGLRVVGTILNGDYLHNRVRAQGGAYGVGVSFEQSGNLVVSSYRDPNLTETLSVYDEIEQYLNSLTLTDEELTQYIIGTIAQLDPALTALQAARLQTRRYITAISQEKVQKLRDEVLAANLETVKSAAPLFGKIMEQQFYCVLGNENKIKEHQDIFNELVKLVK